MWISLLLVVVVLCAVGCHGKKKTKWNEIDVNKLEKEWQQGDAEEELENEFEYQRKIGEKRKKSLPAFDPKFVRALYLPSLLSDKYICMIGQEP